MLLWIPKVEVESLLQIVVDARKHRLHLDLEVAQQSVPIVPILDVGKYQFNGTLELLVLFKRVQKLVGLARPERVLR